MRVTVKNVGSQEDALLELAGLVERATLHPAIVRAARQIVSSCPARDDTCELQAIYDAVKYGDPRVAGLQNGVRYTSDARYADQFNSPVRMLAECAEGACAGDCLPLDTLVIVRGIATGGKPKTMPISDIVIGSRIYDGSDWPIVTHYWFKGVQPILRLELDTGRSLRCTPDHRLLKVPANGTRTDAAEVRACDVKVDDELLTPISRPLAKVVAIYQDGEAETCDIETESHKFFLPETDLIVHNCDDQAALISALAGAVGFRTGLRAYGPKNGNGFSHVYAVAYAPKKGPRQTIGLDASVPSAYVGWQPPRGRVVTAMLGPFR